MNGLGRRIIEPPGANDFPQGVQRSLSVFFPFMEWFVAKSLDRQNIPRGSGLDAFIKFFNDIFSLARVGVVLAREKAFRCFFDNRFTKVVKELVAFVCRENLNLPQRVSGLFMANKEIRIV